MSEPDKNWPESEDENTRAAIAAKWTDSSTAQNFVRIANGGLSLLKTSLDRIAATDTIYSVSAQHTPCF